VGLLNSYQWQNCSKWCQRWPPPRRQNAVSFDCGCSHSECTLSTRTWTSRIAWI